MDVLPTATPVTLKLTELAPAGIVTDVGAEAIFESTPLNVTCRPLGWGAVSPLPRLTDTWTDCLTPGAMGLGEIVIGSSACRVAVAVGVTVGVLVLVGEAVGVAVSVGVTVAVGVAVGVLVSVGVTVAVGVAVGVLVSVGAAVDVAVGVGVLVSVGAAVDVGVGVLVTVAVDVGVTLGVAVAVGVGVVGGACPPVVTNDPTGEPAPNTIVYDRCETSSPPTTASCRVTAAGWKFEG